MLITFCFFTIHFLFSDFGHLQGTQRFNLYFKQLHLSIKTRQFQEGLHLWNSVNWEGRGGGEAWTGQMFRRSKIPDKLGRWTSQKRNLVCRLESISFKLRMLHDTAMIHSRYIHNAFQIQAVTAQYIFFYLPRQVLWLSMNVAHGLSVNIHLWYISASFMIPTWYIHS